MVKASAAGGALVGMMDMTDRQVRRGRRGRLGQETVSNVQG